MALTIISLIKQVPLPSEMRMGEDGLMDRTKAKSIINIDCQFGLEAGLQLKKQYPDARLIVCSMGPKSFENALRKAISMGYDDAYLLSDRKLGGSDTYATGLALSTMLKHLGFTKDSADPFIILAGRQTSDGDTAHVPSQVAESIGIPQATFVESIKADGKGNIIAKRIIEGGFQMLKLPMPCLISMTPTGIPPRKSSLSGAIRARSLNITTFGIDDIGLGTEKIGLNGSPTIVVKVVNIGSERPPIKMSFTAPLLIADALDVAVGAREVRPIRLAALLALAYLCSVYFLVFGGLAYALIVGIAALRRRDLRCVTARGPRAR